MHKTLRNGGSTKYITKEILTVRHEKGMENVLVPGILICTATILILQYKNQEKIDLEIYVTGS